MENRVTRAEEARGWALAALVAILVITAAWWALALWPAGAIEPVWLIRTRAACFGSRPGGLPDAGGWVLLIGEPLGMLVMLGALWGRSLRRDLRWALSRGVWRFAAAGVMAAALLGVVLLGARLARARVAESATPIEVRVTPHRVDRVAPALPLVDQRGVPTSFPDFRGQTVLLTFAYGHCATVCPSIVNDLRSARRVANRPDVPLVIVTLDPWRDTPDRLPTLAEHWALEPGDRVLSGGVGDVEAILDELGIGRRRDETTGDIDHSTAVMVLDEHGRIAWRIDGGASGIDTLIRRKRIARR